MKKFEELGGEVYYLEVFPNGEVHWMPYQVFESKCDMDITYFPFDTQVCDITFISWSFFKLEVNMMLPESGPPVYFYDFNETQSGVLSPQEVEGHSHILQTRPSRLLSTFVGSLCITS